MPRATSSRTGRDGDPLHRRQPRVHRDARPRPRRPGVGRAVRRRALAPLDEGRLEHVRRRRRPARELRVSRRPLHARIGVPPGADPAAGRARPVRGLARPPRGARPRASPQAGRRRLRRCPRVARRARTRGPAGCVRSTARPMSSRRCRRRTSTRWTSSGSRSRSAASLPGSRCPSRSSWCRCPTHARRPHEPDSRDPTPPRGRLTPPGRGAPLPRAKPPLARAASADAPADPDRPRRRHVVPASLSRAAHARQGLPGLGRRRQRVPRPPDRRLGDDPRPRERAGSARRSSAQLEQGYAVRVARTGT